MIIDKNIIKDWEGILVNKKDKLCFNDIKGNVNRVIGWATIPFYTIDITTL